MNDQYFYTDQYLDQDQYTDVDLQVIQIDAPHFTQSEIDYYADFIEATTFEEKLNQIINDCFTVGHISNDQYKRNSEFDDEAVLVLLPALKGLLIHQLGLLKHLEISLLSETPVAVH